MEEYYADYYSFLVFTIIAPGRSERWKSIMLVHQIPCIYYYEPREMRAIEPMKLLYVSCCKFFTLPRIACFLLAPPLKLLIVRSLAVPPTHPSSEPWPA